MKGANAPQFAGRPAATKQPVVLDDKFVEIDGECFAGLHLLLEFWDAQRLDDEHFIEAALKGAAEAARATVLDIRLHKFLSGGGVTGVALLAESHISIHTWPKRGYAAVDIFMCGGCDAYQAVAPLEQAFVPAKLEISEKRRGRLSADTVIR
jgi:S-adenosylmethionine decarboxylase